MRPTNTRLQEKPTKPTYNTRKHKRNKKTQNHSYVSNESRSLKKTYKITFQGDRPTEKPSRDGHTTVYKMLRSTKKKKVRQSTVYPAIRCSAEKHDRVTNTTVSRHNSLPQPERTTLRVLYNPG